MGLSWQLFPRDQGEGCTAVHSSHPKIEIGVSEMEFDALSSHFIRLKRCLFNEANEGICCSHHYNLL